MVFRKSEGNMYPWVTHTWNVIKGKCPHDCVYCYMKRFPQGELRFDEKEMKRNLGAGNFIFVGSSCDMFAEDISDLWIKKVLSHCYPFENKYLFQSKNPSRMWDYNILFPYDSIFGTTIESDKDYNISKAPHVFERAVGICEFKSAGFKTIVTIEPVLDFNINTLVKIVRVANPSWVNIGADSKGHNLPEPSWGKVQELIIALKEFTEVKVKSNLGRLKCQK